MTAITASGTLTQQLYMRLFDRLNTDGDDALSLSEIGGATPSQSKSEKIFNALDADRDGRVIRAEMTPSESFSAKTLGSLIAAQSADDANNPANPGTAAVADLFARADLDGDGALSAEEMKAERDLRHAASLDAGYAAGPIFVTNDKNDDGMLTADEVIGTGRALKSLALPDSAIRFRDELPEEQQKQFQAMREMQGLPPLPKLTAEEKAAQRAQWAADRAERASGPEGTMTFLSREIEGLRAQASAAYAKQDVSGSLGHRLLQQVLSEAWKTEATA
ncbi:MAG: hypothetical protein BGN86_15775 [Caulobacterales bacterium 68-7]|nr:MAG: hypothetical protein BGN86_15775 [Caulobacterales bacterium 68-7]